MTKISRLEQQVGFIREIDRLKHILRRTYLTDESRFENAVEHSWHLAVMAMVLAEHANTAVDLTRVMQMLLIHDIVEIDAGDTFAYDEIAMQDQRQREAAAADRLFALLPEDQNESFRALWEEFEAKQTNEAKFAEALDRFHPLLHNIITQGRSWREHNICKQQVIDKNRHIAGGADGLWQYIRPIIDDLAAQGLLADPAQMD